MNIIKLLPNDLINHSNLQNPLPVVLRRRHKAVNATDDSKTVIAKTALKILGAVSLVAAPWIYYSTTPPQNKSFPTINTLLPRQNSPPPTFKPFSPPRVPTAETSGGIRYFFPLVGIIFLITTTVLWHFRRNPGSSPNTPINTPQIHPPERLNETTEANTQLKSLTPSIPINTLSIKPPEKINLSLSSNTSIEDLYDGMSDEVLASKLKNLSSNTSIEDLYDGMSDEALNAHLNQSDSLDEDPYGEIAIQKDGKTEMQGSAYPLIANPRDKSILPLLPRKDTRFHD